MPFSDQEQSWEEWCGHWSYGQCLRLEALRQSGVGFALN